MRLPLTLTFSGLLENRGLLDYPSIRKVPYKYFPKTVVIKDAKIVAKFKPKT